ncbi:hypothetical protein [Kitasatospora sp. McL0602]|uniref:hypothetical protein n=1 Tax=Kitasatospora sp. McL0602 TaxID=3439530 RepID=UPI003F8AEB73
MSNYPLHCTVRRSESTTDLLTALHDADPGFATYLLAAWEPDAVAQSDVALPQLAALLDEPLALRKPRTGHTPSRRLTWHCSIRSTVPASFTDDDWFELAWEVLDATGIEPEGDQHSCRWVALRATSDRLDIVATVIRQDGRWARLHNDEHFARFACEKFSRDHGASPR